MRASWSVALTPIVFERRLRRVDRGGGLRDLRPVVVVCQQHQLVAFANALVVIHLHFTNESGDLRAQRREIAPDVTRRWSPARRVRLPTRSSCA